MFYVIIRNQQGHVAGFMVDDDDETPSRFETEEAAEKAIDGHVMESFMEVVEL